MGIRLFFILFFVSNLTLGQDRFLSGIFPEFGLNAPINDRWSYLFKLESQNRIIDNAAMDYPSLRYKHLLTDLQSFMSVNITYSLKGAFGYQYRIDSDKTDSHRSIQQIAWVSNFRTFRIGSRVRTDQTFLNDAPPEYRFRYRAASDIPLQGMKIDDGEQYLLLSNEFILGIQSNEYSFENRFVAGIGHFFNNKEKLEFSLDYRTDPYFSGVNRHRLWIKISFYWKLGKFFSIN